ncbi:ABC transporter ATP-binding protein, partial [Frankia sp. CNm7]|nr:ABC transporter ATP-binding protein [Frankia nepalensis]
MTQTPRLTDPAASAARAPAIELRGITKRYGPVGAGAGLAQAGRRGGVPRRRGAHGAG